MATALDTSETRRCEVCGGIYSRGSKSRRQFAQQRTCSRKCYYSIMRGRSRRPYKLSTHGMSHSPEFVSWWAMRQRCENPRVRYYENYGGRGIRVCERWHSFDHFFADMGPRPSHDHSLDRIDVNGNYEPGNCRWATCAEQMRNRRDNVYITIGHETKVLKDWARQFGISPMTVRGRLKRGMAPIEALTLPPDSTRRSSASGAAGVYEHPGRPRPWQARVQDGGRFRSLGYFSTKAEAVEARQRYMIAAGIGVPD